MGKHVLPVAKRLRRDENEMKIMGIVADGIDANSAGLGDIGLIDCRCCLVGLEQSRWRPTRW